MFRRAYLNGGKLPLSRRSIGSTPLTAFAEIQPVGQSIRPHASWPSLLQVFDHQLRAFHAHVFVDRQPVGRPGAAAGLGAEIELDGIDAAVALAQAQLEVLFLEDALLFDIEF